MPTYNIAKTTSSDMTNTAAFDYKVPAMSTDGVSQQDETEYQKTNWNYQWGYFNTNADLKAAITMKAIWNVGRGWTTSPEDANTKVVLGHICGWEKILLMTLCLTWT